MYGLGLHVLMEFHDCEALLLDDSMYLEELMKAAAIASEATIVKSVFHQFSPQGVTGVVVIAESHLAIHTWPEHGYAAVDFFTCNSEIPYTNAFELIGEKLKSKRNSFETITRGEIKPVGDQHELSKY